MSQNAADLDRQGRPVVVVTGMGLLTSLGEGVEDNWRRLCAGDSGIRRIGRFALDGLRTTIAGTVDFVPAEPNCAPELSERMADRVCREAIAQSGIGARGDFPGPLFLALPPVELEWPQRQAMAATVPDAEGYGALLLAAGSGAFKGYYERFLFGSVAENLAVRFGTRGSPVAVSTACASGATAIQLALEAIRRGEAEAALCVGTDASVNPESLVRFSLLSALSTRNEVPEAASRPFSKDRDGFVMAEGAAALVLESLASAKARGARILGVVEGCGERADSFHRTRSNPDGRPIIASMADALEDAGVAADAVDYINAHGTSTPENDRMEWHCVAAVFGERAGSLPISSTKSMLGHTLTAAGTIEAVVTLLSLRDQRIAPTINYLTPDPALPLDCVPNVARDAVMRRAISNSFGFGGQNLCLVLKPE
ncbi:MAG TPA: beta-ketoacyl-ACP synthase [Acetobacteraceae bacterium]|jgi:3-oxoacyl-[acyl-carrier-protein] synthase II|nr:beta-ketoacyl-ACP synthase [Acetobacteraceae bacterium]